MIKLLIDTKGGDNGAAVMVKGACDALDKFEELGVEVKKKKKKTS